MSVLMSSPGPLIVGLGLMTGKSSTQLADFIRRSAELRALICSYVVYKMSYGEKTNAAKKARLERGANLFVGFSMCLSGAVMLVLALVSSNTEKGNVIPGLAIALMGVIANTLFWRKYTKLSRLDGNAIMSVQARLYGAKSLVDGCVTIALGTVALFPASMAAYYLDKAGSAIVAVYLLLCGIKTVKECGKIKPLS